MPIKPVEERLERLPVLSVAEGILVGIGEHLVENAVEIEREAAFPEGFGVTLYLLLDVAQLLLIEEEQEPFLQLREIEAVEAPATSGVSAAAVAQFPGGLAVQGGVGSLDDDDVLPLTPNSFL